MGTNSELFNIKQLGFAASLGRNLGTGFGDWLRGQNNRSGKYSNQQRPASSSQRDINNFTKSQLNYNPIKLKLAESFGFSVFPDTASFRSDVGVHGFHSGTISDPFSGDTFSFNGPDEYAEVVKKMDENRKNYLRDRARADLLISSAGEPDQVEKIFESTAPLKDGEPVLNRAYKREMADKVKDAVIAHASSMSLSQLKAFSSKYPGLASLIQSREALLLKSNIGLQDGERLTIRGIERKLDGRESEQTALQRFVSDFKDFTKAEIDGLVDALKQTKASIYKNQLERSANTDYGIYDLNKPTKLSKRELRNLLDWYSTIDLA